MKNSALMNAPAFARDIESRISADVGCQGEELIVQESRPKYQETKTRMYIQ